MPRFPVTILESEPRHAVRITVHEGACSLQFNGTENTQGINLALDECLCLHIYPMLFRKAPGWESIKQTRHEIVNWESVALTISKIETLDATTVVQV